MSRHIFDGIEPEVVDAVDPTIRAVDGVPGITDLRARRHSRQLGVDAAIAVDPAIAVKEGHDAAVAGEHALHHEFSFPVAALIHVDPDGPVDAHDEVAHHRYPPAETPSATS